MGSYYKTRKGEFDCRHDELKIHQNGIFLDCKYFYIKFLSYVGTNIHITFTCHTGLHWSWAILVLGLKDDSAINLKF